MELTDTLITSVLKTYGFQPGAGQCELIRIYIKLLLRWSKQISLTRVIAPLDILKFHFGESLYALTTTDVGNGRLADVGSGAGFPGIPLAIADAQLRVVLIEPNLKKSVFLSEIKRELKLDNAEVVRGRMEDIRLGPLDYVASRAVGQFDELLKFADESLEPRGKVVLWIGSDDHKRVVARHTEWHWLEPKLIPDSERRFMVTGMRRSD